MLCESSSEVTDLGVDQIFEQVLNHDHDKTEKKANWSVCRLGKIFRLKQKKPDGVDAA